MKLKKSTGQLVIKLLQGRDIEPHIDAVSHLRTKLFREFPYLYEGSIAYEKDYIKGYLSDNKSLFVVAFDGDSIVGAITGIPLASESEVIVGAADLFRACDIDPSVYYYIGEGVVLPAYRDAKTALAMYKLMLNQIKQWKIFNKLCFVAVEREENHPLRPKNYSSLVPVFKRLGYKKTDITFSYNWPTIQTNGSVKDAENELTFWVNETVK